MRDFCNASTHREPVASYISLVHTCVLAHTPMHPPDNCFMKPTHTILRLGDSLKFKFNKVLPAQSPQSRLFFFFLNNPPPPEISPLPQHDTLPISRPHGNATRAADADADTRDARGWHP